MTPAPKILLNGGTGHGWNDLAGWNGLDGYLVEYPVQPISLDESLVDAGSDWKYLDDGSTPVALWRSTTFDDSNRSVGSAELGYGDGDESTIVGFGSDVNDKHTTTHFRHSFGVNSPAFIERL